MDPERREEFPGERRREIPCVGNELPKEGSGEAWHGLPVIDIAGCEGHPESLALIVDDEMQFAAKEPPHRHSPPGGSASQDSLRGEPTGMAHGQRGRVDKRDAGTPAIALAEISAQRAQGGRDEFHTARITASAGQLGLPVSEDLSGGEGFAGAILRVMEGDQNRHDLAQAELAGTLAALLPMGD